MLELGWTAIWTPRASRPARRQKGEEGDVAEEVQEAAIHEQRGDRGFPPREAAGVGEHVGRRAVVPGDLDAGSAEEAAAVADLEHVGEHVEPDQENGDQREPRERNVVFDGEDPARLAELCRRSIWWKPQA